MSSPLFTIKEYLSYRLRARNAHGIHSPFVFEFYNEVLHAPENPEEKKLLKYRKKLLRDRSAISFEDPKTKTYRKSSIRKLVKRSAATHRFACAIRRLVNLMGYQAVLETGTSIGLTTAYLASSNASSVATLEGSLTLSEKARELLSDRNIHFFTGTLEKTFENVLDTIQPELVYLDADHRRESILENLRAIDHCPSVKCIVIHDIYWSKEMNQAWQSLVHHPKYSLTIDIFQAGIIFPNYPTEKQHFSLKF